MTTPANSEKTAARPGKKKPSFLKVLCISLLIVFCFLAFLEAGARLLQRKNTQPIRSIGNFHSQFETKWFKLNDYVKANGGVDVLLMGNSMVNTGVDADVMAQAYEEKTGVNPRIFNFGVEGMDIHTNSELAALLNDEFHPGTILFFTEMREYGPGNDPSVPEGYQKAAWFQYQLGNPTFEGWLYDHSALMQYFLPYRNWSRADFPDTVLKDLYRYAQTTPSGYEPDRAYGRDLDVRTDPTDPAQKVLFDLYTNYSPDEANLEDFSTILDLEKSGVQVAVTEMPIYWTFFDYFGGETVHQEFLSTIEALAIERGAEFITPVDAELIPLVGRVDNHHLNFEGAPIYSELLGAELGDLCVEGTFCFSGEAAE